MNAIMMCSATPTTTMVNRLGSIWMPCTEQRDFGYSMWYENSVRSGQSRVFHVFHASPLVNGPTNEVNVTEAAW
jgi:hypothetical protein